MPQRISPNRRRSIAVLGHGPSTSRATQQRRRAYSIAPGEKLSPAARARTLAPRKSILKGSVNARPSQEFASASPSIDDIGSNNVTITMDLTEVVKSSMPRKSLGRRVSFASHAHVRLFEKRDPNTSGDERRIGGEDSIDSEDDDSHAELNFQDDDSKGVERIPSRRRSSTGFNELGEESMDMDMDDTAPIPQDFLNLNGPNLRDEQFDDESYGDDMDMTEGIPGSIHHTSTLLPGNISLPVQRKPGVTTILTSSQLHSENQVSRRPEAAISQAGDSQPTRALYPSLEDAPDPSPPQAQMLHQAPDISAAADNSALDLSIGSADPTISSAGDDTTQPMEFTIPVVRPPPPPSQMWLDLRAMTHAGAEEPYVPPEMEAIDDPEANVIVPSSGHPIERSNQSEAGHDDSMDLTVALSRLAKARPSLGLPPLPDDLSSPIEDDEVDVDGGHDETFSSHEDSFEEDMSLDGNQTVNLTKLRRSLGGLSVTENTTMDLTNVYGQREQHTAADVIPEKAGASLVNEEAANVNFPDIQQPVEQPIEADEVRQPLPPPKKPIFTFKKPASLASSSTLPSLQPGLQPQRQSQPPKEVESYLQPTKNLPIFTLAPISQSASLTKHAPLSPQPPRSPMKPSINATVPTPFTFTVPRLRGSPVKTASAPKAASPTKLPIFRGTAAFAPSSATKSPMKRPAPRDEGDRDSPSPAKKQAVGRLALRSNPQTAARSDDAPHNRRLSAVRRPSGYFAQRKSLGGATTHPIATEANLSQSVSTPSVSSGSPTTNMENRAEADSPAEAPQQTDSQMTPRVGSILTAAAQSTSPSPEIPESRVERAPSPTQSLITNAPSLHGSNRRISSVARPLLALQQTGATDKSRIPPTSNRAPVEPEPEHTTTTQVSGHSPYSEEPASDEIGVGMDMTDQWREGIAVGDEEDEPTISIEQFFEMTNIRFMDEITAPRRSMIHAGHLGMRNRRRSLTSSHSEETEQIPLAEFMTAMAVDVPQLELYHDLASQLTAWVEESKKICRQAEDDAVKLTPALFREFAEADELEKQDLLHQLKLIKANNIDSAKSQWYDWKSTWVAQLQESAEAAFAELESDAKTLESITSQAQGILPSLREEYAHIVAELDKEEADIAEIENSDKNFLSDLKASIADQDLEVQAQRANVSEAQAKLNRLQEREAEIQIQKEDLESAISHSQELIQRQTESTSSEVFRLKDELEALEDLHLWRATKLDANLKEFVYASRIHVSIPCVAHQPDVSRLRVQRTKASREERDEFPELSGLMLTSAQHIAAASRKTADLRTIIQRLSDFWTSCAEIRLQLTFLAVQYPLELKLHPNENSLPTFEVSAKVLFPSVKSKANIKFIFDPDTYTRWPLSIGLLQCDATVAYGRADRQQILAAIQSRLSQATSSESHGCLLDACIEATEQLAFA
ncbi:Spc7 kinetochore protein-domain-containing protein [Cytidiella melzeri]|nr:Spc7 kinetochore protein-domain-containing protein [Cytidiella melzeri]